VLLACLLEFVSGGTLEDHLKKDKMAMNEDKLSWKKNLLRIMTECALGVQYLHKTRFYSEEKKAFEDCIIHRDLKPDNMLLTEDMVLKLTDFGEARAIDDNSTMTQVGTPIYVAPEILVSGRYTSKVDSYSFGICLVACIRSEPSVLKFFVHGLCRHMKKKKAMGIGLAILNNRMLQRRWRPTLPTKLFKSLKKLICDCWQHDPELRPTFDEIVMRLNGPIRDEVTLKQEHIFVNDDDFAKNSVDYEVNEGDGDDDDSEEEKYEETIKTFKEKVAELEATLESSRRGDLGYNINDNIKALKEKVAELKASLKKTWNGGVEHSNSNREVKANDVDEEAVKTEKVEAATPPKKSDLPPMFAGMMAGR